MPAIATFPTFLRFPLGGARELLDRVLRAGGGGQMNHLGGGASMEPLAAQVVAANWWEAGGATACVAAYQPKGAASLAASYVNRANAGTHDAANGDAPSWDTANGWDFNGTSNYLDLTGLTQLYGTVIARVTLSANPVRTIIGGNNAVGVLQFRVESSGKLRFVKMQVADIGQSTGTVSDGVDVVIAATYQVGAQEFFINGVSAGTLTSGVTVTTGQLEIGNNTRAEFMKGKMKALALYTGVLSGATLAAVSTAAAAL